MEGFPPVIAADSAGIEQAAAAILDGGVIAAPTETLYGLLALALDGAAVEAVARLKGRPAGQPVPVLVRDMAMAEALVQEVPAAARRLMEQHWPGPLTLVLPARPGLSPLLLGDGGGLGLRVSSDPVVGQLMAQVGAPLTATSANLSGAPAATTAPAARLPGVALVLDGGPREAAPSTVAAVQGEQVRVLRQGGIKI